MWWALQEVFASCVADDARRTWASAGGDDFAAFLLKRHHETPTGTKTVRG
jgi:hypothetical protein